MYLTHHKKTYSRTPYEVSKIHEGLNFKVSFLKKVVRIGRVTM